jgi:hypothetical protein
MGIVAGEAYHQESLEQVNCLIEHPVFVWYSNVKSILLSASLSLLRMHFALSQKIPCIPLEKKHISETNFSFASVNLLSITLYICLHLFTEAWPRTSQVVHSVRDPGAIIFLKSKFSYFLSSNSTHKTKTGTMKRWEITHSKERRAVIMIGPIRNREQKWDHTYYTLLWYRC